MNFVGNPDSVQVVNVGSKPISFMTTVLAFFAVSLSSRMTGEALKSGDDVSHTLDSSFDDTGMMDVRNERNDTILIHLDSDTP